MRSKGFFMPRVKSFSHAFAGIGQCVRAEKNARLHVAATVLVIAASWSLRISSSQAIELTFAIGFVWVSEMFNACIEKIMNFISVEENPAIRFIKDLSAGAVLVASLTTIIIGLVIFILRL
jgi:diacylglycerol kinase